jgi:hypothetical protein
LRNHIAIGFCHWNTFPKDQDCVVTKAVRIDGVLHRNVRIDRTTNHPQTLAQVQAIARQLADRIEQIVRCNAAVFRCGMTSGCRGDARKLAPLSRSVGRRSDTRRKKSS